MGDVSPTDAGILPHPRYIAVFGTLGTNELRHLRTAASSLAFEQLVFDTPAALAAQLERRLPAAILVAADRDGALEVLTNVRSDVRYASTPLLGLTREPTARAFGRLYEWGGDDLVSAQSPNPLLSRLLPILRRTPALAPAEPPGMALVATCNLRWRNVLARTLWNVGIEPRFVGNGVDTLVTSGPPPLFVVASDDLPPDGASAALSRARAAGSTTPWLVATPTNRIPAVRDSLRTYEQVAVVDLGAPPDNFLFTANELRRPRLGDQRANPRALYGTAVHFRVLGSDEDDIGFTYNVSTSGVFVRTLAPLDAGQQASIELFAPGGDRAARLAGRVAWRRDFGPNETATSPPGFGIQVMDGLAPGHLDLWENACEKLIADRSPAPPRDAVQTMPLDRAGIV